MTKCSSHIKHQDSSQLKAEDSSSITTELKILLRRMETIRRNVGIKKVKQDINNKKSSKRDNILLRKLKMYNFLVWANEDVFAGNDNQLNQAIELIEKQQVYYQQHQRLDSELSQALDRSFQSLGIQLRSCISPRSSNSKLAHTTNPIAQFFISIIDGIFRKI